MLNRLEKKFADLKRSGRTAFIPFITAGDPNLQQTLAYARALEKGGADIIELGVPFSDPMADGPVIQKADERALRAGTNLKKILNIVAKLRKNSDIPIVLMGYYNPIFYWGVGAFARAAAEAGVDACLIADLPADEADEVITAFDRARLDLIFLVALTSDRRRIKKIARVAKGYLYFVALTGITGAKLTQTRTVAKKVRVIRQATNLPIAVGFGIATPRQARAVARFADGVVVGSAFVKKIAERASPRALERMTRSFRKALNGSGARGRKHEA